MEKEHHQHHTSNYDRFMSGEYCNSLNPEVLEMISNTKACLVLPDLTARTWKILREAVF